MATRFLAYRPLSGCAPIAGPGFTAASPFRIVYASPYLVVWVDRPEATRTLPDGHGVVCGWTFSAGGTADPGNLLPTDCSPDTLLRALWGGYVAFLTNPDRGATQVLRDPSGIMPCLRIRAATGDYLVSDLATAREAGLAHGGIDWTGMALHLQAASFPIEPTALHGVRELLPGFALTLSDLPAESVSIWSPWHHVRPPERNYGATVEVLREAIESCVTTWASAFHRIVLDLSGGLDSAIVASALTNSGVDRHALNFASEGGGADDERGYARLVADRCGIPLHETLLALDDVDILQPTFPDIPAPIGRCIGQAMDISRARLAVRERSDGFFNGVGGDNLFCYLRSAAPVTDRLRSEGPGIGVCRTIEDVCGITRASIPTVLRMAVRQLRRSSRPWQPYMTLLDPDYRAPAEAFHHPWLDAPMGSLPGKKAHVAALLRISTHFNAFTLGAGPPLISPFRSQPLIELCLSIPSWFWSRGGHDRAVARDGFAGRLPPSVIARRSKAGPEPFCFQLLARDRSLIRERLLDGRLARERIIDRPSIEEVFRTNAPFKADVYLRLLELADAEAWVDHWSDRTTKGGVSPPDRIATATPPSGHIG